MATAELPARQFRWNNPDPDNAQKWFFNRGPEPTALIGGVGSGKTTAGALKIIALSDLYPGSRWAVVRKVHKHLKYTTMRTFYELLDARHYDKGQRNDQDGYLKLNNGSEVHFIHLESDSSLGRLDSLELTGCWVDQAEELSEAAWDKLTSRVGRCQAKVPQWLLDQTPEWPWRRGSLDGSEGEPMPPRYRFVTAYATDELHWLWQRFDPESPEHQTKWKALGYEQRVCTSMDNRMLGDSYLKDLQGRDEAWVRRYVLGIAGNPEGRVFKLLPDSILEPNEDLLNSIRNHMMLHRVLDHGDTAPTCCGWFGTDGDNNIYMAMEYYQPGRDKNGQDWTIRDHRRAIHGLSNKAGWKHFYSNLADPAIFAKTRNITAFADRSARWSVADEYSDRQIINDAEPLFWQPADKGEMMTRSRLREYLRADPNHKHPVTGQMGAPHLYLIKASPEHPHGCDHVITELKAAKFVQIGENNGRPIYSDEREAGPQIPDHALDVLRYFVGSRPPLMLPLPDPRKYSAALGEAEPGGRRPIVVTIPKMEYATERPRAAKEWKSRGRGY